MPMDKPTTDSNSDEGQYHERSTPFQQDMPDSFNSSEPTGLRILCLHDAHSSASGLKSHLSMLGDRLYQKHGIDLVYINSPLCALAFGGDTNRVWYETHAKQRPSVEETQQDDEAQEQLLGLDASLCLLQQIWASMPFWGILGIGQGAAVGSLVSLLPDIKPRAKFGIFIQGEALIQEAEQLIDTGDEWACLHVIGTIFIDYSSSLCVVVFAANLKFNPFLFADPDVKIVTGGRLIQQFGGAVHQVSRNGEDGYSKKVLNIIGKVSIHLEAVSFV
jgi:Serine hydrolase (FSH1)